MGNAANKARHAEQDPKNAADMAVFIAHWDASPDNATRKECVTGVTPHGFDNHLYNGCKQYFLRHPPFRWVVAALTVGGAGDEDRVEIPAEFLTLS